MPDDTPPSDGDEQPSNIEPTADPTADNAGEEPERRRVHVTRGLVDVLLEMGEEAEPKPANVVLAPTPAGEFDEDLGLDPETPVLTHFYMSEAGQSVSAVFGMDLGTPAGRGRARFLTHPQVRSSSRSATTSRPWCSSPSPRGSGGRSPPSTAPDGSWNSSCSTPNRRRKNSTDPTVPG